MLNNKEQTEQNDIRLSEKNDTIKWSENDIFDTLSHYDSIQESHRLWGYFAKKEWLDNYYRPQNEEEDNLDKELQLKFNNMSNEEKYTLILEYEENQSSLREEYEKELEENTINCWCKTWGECDICAWESSKLYSKYTELGMD